MTHIIKTLALTPALGAFWLALAIAPGTTGRHETGASLFASVASIAVTPALAHDDEHGKKEDEKMDDDHEDEGHDKKDHHKDHKDND